MKNQRLYIVVDGNNKPMSFAKKQFENGGGQFCYVSRRGRSRFYLKTYTEKEAKKLIKETIENRALYNLGADLNYYMMPLSKFL